MCRFIQYIVLYASFCAPYSKRINLIYYTFSNGQLYSYTFSFRDEKDKQPLLIQGYLTRYHQIKSSEGRYRDYTLFTEFNEEQSMLQNIFHISALLLATSHYEIP